MQRIAVLCLACLVAVVGVAADAPKRKAKAKPRPKKAPEKLERLEVWAETIKYDGGKGTFKFNGDVTVIKGDLRVDCNEMEGSVDPKTRRITKVMALGNVRMVTVGKVTPDPSGRRPALKPAGPDAWRATSGQADRFWGNQYSFHFLVFHWQFYSSSCCYPLLINCLIHKFPFIMLLAGNL